MNLEKFGGDNRDHGKGFILLSLQAVLKELHVDAMITDDGSEDDIRCMLNFYRRFLGLADGQPIINAEHRYRGGTKINRGGMQEDYFQPHYDKSYDLFLNPDDGIHSEGGSKDVTPAVIEKLIPKNCPRVLMVYTSPTRDTREGHRLEDHFRKWFDCRLSGFFCWLAGNGILFLARPENKRLEGFKEAVKKALGPFETRVRDLSDGTSGYA